MKAADELAVGAIHAPSEGCRPYSPTVINVNTWWYVALECCSPYWLVCTNFVWGECGVTAGTVSTVHRLLLALSARAQGCWWHCQHRAQVAPGTVSTCTGCWWHCQHRAQVAARTVSPADRLFVALSASRTGCSWNCQHRAQVSAGTVSPMHRLLLALSAASTGCRWHCQQRAQVAAGTVSSVHRLQMALSAECTGCWCRHYQHTIKQQAIVTQTMSLLFRADLTSKTYSLYQ